MILELKNIEDERTRMLEAARLEAADESKTVLAETKQRRAGKIRERSLAAVFGI